MKVTVLVKPNSKKESVEKTDRGEYLVRVNVPPVDGKANKRVVELLSEYFNKPKSAFELVHGSRGKKKIFNLK